MSYQEKNITVSFVSFLFILGYYLLNLLRMQQQGGLSPEWLFRLWAVVIVGGILVNIFSSILTNIVLSILHAIKTGLKEEESFLEDERDQLISLKGNRVSYIAFSIGVLLAMLTFAFGQPPLVMFSLLILSGLVAEILGDLAQIYLYRKGL